MLPQNKFRADKSKFHPIGTSRLSEPSKYKRKEVPAKTRLVLHHRVEPCSRAYKARALTVVLMEHMEQVTGIEPALSAWKAEVLPLDHTCMELAAGIEPATC